MPLDINGEIVQDDEIRSILKMFDHDRKEFAGQFFEGNRSRKFRRVWNENGRLLGRNAQDVFVEYEWKHFHAYVVAWYSERLKEFLDMEMTVPNPLYEKSAATRDRMFKALIMFNMMGRSKEAQDVIQMAPGTQQFEGDKIENKHIAETYGDGETMH